MPNRYKRDLNRLIQHPRRIPGARKARTPGQFNGILSKALGLPREPAPPQFYGDFAFIPSQIDIDGFRTDFGLPEIAGDPLGTPDGDKPCWRLEYDSSFFITKYQEPEYGCRDWQGSNGVVLSWRARPSRVLDGSASSFNSNWAAHFSGSRWVYKNGVQFLNILNEVDANVYGVGATADTITVMTYQFDTQYAIQYPWDGIAVTGPGVISHSVPTEFADYQGLTGWYFNASGTDAIATFRNKNDRDALHVRRYNIDTGFSGFQTVWQRGIEGNATKTYAPYGSDAGLAGYKRAAIITSETVIAQHDVPIYVDYVGDSEVTLYLRHKAYSENATVDVNNEEVDSQTTGNRNEETRTKYQEGVEFVLSTGEVIGSFGPTIDSSYYRNSEDPSFEFASMTLTWNETERFVTETNLLADIRYKVVLFEAREEITDYNFSGQANSEGEISGTGNENTKVSFLLMKSNTELFREDVQITSSTSTIVNYERGEYDSNGYSAENSQDLDVQGEPVPFLWWESQMCNIGYVESNGATAATLCVYYEDWFSVTGQAEWITKNLLTGHADPDAVIFDGRPDMTFYGLGKM